MTDLFSGMAIGIALSVLVLGFMHNDEMSQSVKSGYIKIQKETYKLVPVDVEISYKEKGN